MYIVFWKNADTISVLTVTYSFDTVHERNIQQDGQTDRQTPYDGIGRACAWHREAKKKKLVGFYLALGGLSAMLANKRVQ